MGKKKQTSDNQQTGNSPLGFVTHRFLPQPSEIEKLMKDKLDARKIDDEFGWTGEWRLSAKDVLDIIIDLQNGG